MKKFLNKIFNGRIEPEAEKEPEMITFDAKHDCFVRAQKILKYAGMYCNSDFTNRVARGVKIYMDLDSGIVPLFDCDSEEYKKDGN